MNLNAEVVCLCTHMLCVMRVPRMEGEEEVESMSSFLVNIDVPLYILRCNYYGSYLKTEKRCSFILSGIY